MPIFLHQRVTEKQICAKNIALVSNVLFMFTTAREDKTNAINYSPYK